MLIRAAIGTASVYISHSSRWVCPAQCVSVSLLYRYRAVASWSRVQGVGIPLLTAVEILLIWVLSFILAVPEAIGFNMVSFSYRNMTFHTCMLKPSDSSEFMQVEHSLQKSSNAIHTVQCFWWYKVSHLSFN